MVMKAMRLKASTLRSAFIIAVANLVQAVFESRLRSLASPGPLPLDWGKEHLGTAEVLSLVPAQLHMQQGDSVEAQKQSKMLVNLSRASAELKLSRQHMLRLRLWWHQNPGGKTIHMAIDVCRSHFRHF